METNRITYKHLQQYLEGKLDEKSMHELERQALNDPFLADALEGYSHTESHAGPQLSLLQRQLEERIAVQQQNKNAFYFTWQRISVAAAACLLFTAASMLFWMKGARNQNMVAQQEKKVDVTLTHPDSLGKEAETISKSSKNSPQALAAIPVDAVPSSDKNRENTLAASAASNNKASSSGKKNLSRAGGSSKQKAGSEISSSSARKEQQVIRGSVLSEDGKPLPDVSVKVKGSSASVSTGRDGTFLIVDSAAQFLQFSAPGYKSKEVKVLPGEAVDIILQESNSSLSEVAIGVAGQAGMSSTAAPITGWDKYKLYLKENNRLYSTYKGEVKLAFTVSADGSPSDLKIERSLNERADNEAIRLIKEGAKWKASDSSVIRVTVPFGN